MILKRIFFLQKRQNTHAPTRDTKNKTNGSNDRCQLVGERERHLTQVSLLYSFCYGARYIAARTNTSTAPEAHRQENIQEKTKQDNMRVPVQ